MKRRWKDTLVPFLGFLYIRLPKATVRLEYDGVEHLEQARRSGRFILTLWHSRFAMMRYGYPGNRLAVLISLHRDAQRLGATLRWLGLDTVDGSSTRGGASALREILRRVREGWDIAITPDGPKGPRRRLKAGVITTAHLAGIPILPATFSASPARRVRSWDRTLLPWPFARGLILYGPPVRVPREADDAEQERLRVHVEDEMNRLADEADRRTGIGPEPPLEPEVAA